MITQISQKLVFLFCLAVPISLQAQNAPAKGYQARKVPMILDVGGGFHLCKVKVDGKDAHLLVDSGANMEVTMTKDWTTAEGNEEQIAK